MTLVWQVQRSEKGQFRTPNPGKFRERTGPNLSAGSKFGEKNGPNPGSAGSEFRKERFLSPSSEEMKKNEKNK